MKEFYGQLYGVLNRTIYVVANKCIQNFPPYIIHLATTVECFQQCQTSRWCVAVSKSPILPFCFLFDRFDSMYINARCASVKENVKKYNGQSYPILFIREKNKNQIVIPTTTYIYNKRMMMMVNRTRI